jgi:predicted site-specific integrase-resolvase
MVTPQQASAIAGVSVRTINRWVEAGRVHFMETPDGLLLLCLDSLR